MSVRRLAQVPGFNIDRVAAAAGDDPDVLRLENLDTDLRPRDDLKVAVAAHIERRGGPAYDHRRETVITGGEGEALLDALFGHTFGAGSGRLHRSP